MKASGTAKLHLTTVRIMPIKIGTQKTDPIHWMNRVTELADLGVRTPVVESTPLLILFGILGRLSNVWTY